MQWWRLDGAGHTVASQSVPVASNPVTGIQSRDIEFAEVAWSFFKSRLLPGVADVRSTGLDKPETLPTDGRRPR
jgi:hypothetical protein